MNDKMREEFEAAYLEKYRRKPQNFCNIIDAYKDVHANGAWWGWQESRKVIEIELPCIVHNLESWDDALHGRNDGVYDCAEAIRTVGIRIKGESK
jgi:hypothetical protein